VISLTFAFIGSGSLEFPRPTADEPLVLSKIRHPIQLVLFCSWLLTGSFGASYLTSQHSVAYQVQPLTLPKGATQLSPHNSLQMVHFLGTACNCSQNILHYLQARRAQTQWPEKVFLIGPVTQAQQDLQAAGFAVTVLDEESAANIYGVKSVPQLVLTQGEHILYQGGYNEDQAHNQIYQDLTLAADYAQPQVRAERRSPKYPLFGCANGNLTKNAIDPWRLKYE